MTWEIGFSREAEKFLKLEKIRSQTIEEIKNVINRMKTEAENFIKNGRR